MERPVNGRLTCGGAWPIVWLPFAEVPVPLLGQRIVNTFFACMPPSFAPKLGARAFSSAHVTPPGRIVALDQDVHETRGKPQSGHCYWHILHPKNGKKREEHD